VKGEKDETPLLVRAGPARASLRMRGTADQLLLPGQRMEGGKRQERKSLACLPGLSEGARHLQQPQGVPPASLPHGGEAAPG